MPAYINDYIFDNGLGKFSEVTDLVVCSAQPTTFTEANVTYKLGGKTGPTISIPQAHTTGRKIVVSAITDLNITTNGTATHYALIDTVNSRLFVTQALNSSVAVVVGEFSTNEITIAIPAPIA